MKNENSLPTALFLGITGGIITACAIGAYQLITGMSQAAKDTAGILLIVLPIGALFAMAVIWLMRRKPQNRQQADDAIDMRPYHVQYPLPRQLPQQATQQAISAPNTPQYDDSVMFNPQQAKTRQWAIADEVQR